MFLPFLLSLISSLDQGDARFKSFFGKDKQMPKKLFNASHAFRKGRAGGGAGVGGVGISETGSGI